MATVGACVGIAFFALTTKQSSPLKQFVPYVDVTAFPAADFEESGGILAFIVAHKSNPCTPSWGGEYTLQQADTHLKIDERIAMAAHQGSKIAVSFGGLNNRDLAVGCTDPAKLAAAYALVVERYSLSEIDLDIEASALQSSAANERRAVAIAELQARHPNLAVWVTLPVTSEGLTEAGLQALNALTAKNVRVTGVNIMTMNFGLVPGQTMTQATESALTHTHHQLATIYKDASSEEIWTKIGATPMVGRNDLDGEVFTLDDAKKLHAFAKSKNLGRVSMWSVNRDVPCLVVSSFCNGVNKPKGAFANILGQGF